MKIRKMKIEDIVTPDTPAGLQLAEVPVDGKYKQKRNVTCVFKGTGKVIGLHEIIINYDTWPGIYSGVGTIHYQDCLIECEAGTGWGGAGAVKRI